MTRREFLRLVAVAGVSGAAFSLASCDKETREQFFQKHFLEMTAEEKKQMVTRLQDGYARKYGKKFDISVQGAKPDTLWGYGLDLSRCIGCRRCVYGCVRENNLSRHNPQVQWIRVLRMKKGNLIDLQKAEHYYNPPQVPEEGYFYMPVQCQHCENPPCVKVCPVHATWKEPDGLVVVDYNWCIGCRYCITACPYRGRTFNWSEPKLNEDDWNTSVHYLGNRPRFKNVVDKCTFCVQRVRMGKYPACVEACPTGTRKFGNLLDPDSEIRYLIDHKRVFRLKEDLNTQPKFYYFFAE
jgi:Fe-S-cluster-containing dehydrogenase component